MADTLIDYGPLGLIGLVTLVGLVLVLLGGGPVRPPEAPKPPALPDPAVIRKLREGARKAAMAAEDQARRG